MSIHAGAWALERTGITPSEKWLLFLLADSAGMDSETSLTAEDLAAVSLLPIAKVHEALVRLTARGMISPVRGGGGVRVNHPAEPDPSAYVKTLEQSAAA
jgi:DNA-binding MarR family transcriptional regulator